MSAPAEYITLPHGVWSRPACYHFFLLVGRCVDFISLAKAQRKPGKKRASRRRFRETIGLSLREQPKPRRFDVFLCYNTADKVKAKSIAGALRKQGIQPWFDEWELRPGLPWQRALEKQISGIRAAVVFIGKSGIGPWQDVEQAALIRQFVRRGCPVIPTILPDCVDIPEFPLFLQGMPWVDFRASDPDPMQQLIWGITGRRDPAKPN